MGNENTKISGRASRGIILNLVLAGGNEISEILAAVTTSRVSGLSIADTLTQLVPVHVNSGSGQAIRTEMRSQKRK